MTTFDQLTSIIRKHRIASDRAAFILGVEWAAKNLTAAAALVEADKTGSVKTPDGSYEDAIMATGSPTYASRLRDLASALITEAQTTAPQIYPDWKD